jgi:putative membrane protein
VGKATVSGIAFGNNAVITLSLAPHGADDIPDDLQIAIQNHADKLGFTKLLVVDSHNSMGHNLDTQDNADMAEAAKRCLTELKNATQYPFSVGYANSQSTSELSQEVGRAGLAVLGLKINDSYFAIGWADANNIQNGLREAIISSVAAVHDGSSSSSSRRQLLELCSSDTHATSGKRTREGYFPMGTTTNHELITSVFRNLCEQAWATMETSTFEISNVQSKVKVMGEQQFEDYSKALDNSIRVTKAFLIASVATFIAMLVL